MLRIFLDQTFNLRWAEKVRSDLDLINDYVGEEANRNMLITDDDMFRNCIVQRLAQIAENQALEERREVERTGMVERALARKEGALQEEHLFLESNVNFGEDPSTVDSQLERLDNRTENERKKKLKKRRQENGIDGKIPCDLLRRLEPLFTKWNIPHEAAVEIVATTYKECKI